MDNLIKSFYANKNPQYAIKMEAYLRNQFLFLGIKNPIRKILQKEFLLARKKTPILWDEVDVLTHENHREFHYVALDLLRQNRREIEIWEVPKLNMVLEHNSWWESIDPLFDVYFSLFQRDRVEMIKYFDEFSQSNNIWKKRCAICFQLKASAETDTELLSKYILENTNTKEFFVDKAIGWALREFGKTDPNWVVNFVETHNQQLSTLSKRESLRIIGV